MSLFKKYPAIVCAAVAVAMLAAPLAAQASYEKPGEGKTVDMARPTWTTGFFLAELYKQMVEKLGYDVDMTTLANPAFYRSVSMGDIDFWVNSYYPLQKTYEDIFKPNAKMIGYVVKNGALQGYLMSKKVVDKYNIQSLADLNRPEVRKALDTDGDGKVDLVACPPGWGCEKVISYQLEHYDWGKYVNPIKASYAASMAAAIAKFNEGKPIFFYTWTPNWTVGILKPGKDVVWVPVKEVKLPPKRAQFEDETVVDDLEGCAVSGPCQLGWVANDIRPLANKKFLRENPAIKELLKLAHIPLEDIYAQNAAMHHGADDPEDIERQANDWIDAHKEMVGQWLHRAREAAAAQGSSAD